MGLVHSLHDITEGGLATALHELASASGLGIAIEEDSVPVLPETADLCNALGLHPVGPVGVGFAGGYPPRRQCTHRLLHKLERAGIDAWEIGQMLPAEEGRILFTPPGRGSSVTRF